jgi:plastocyanin
MHCHVLVHMMDGMMGSLLVIMRGELALGLPTGEPCTAMGGGHGGGGIHEVEVAVRNFNFNPVNISIMAGQTVVWKWEVATSHSLRHRIQEFGILTFYQESA